MYSQALCSGLVSDMSSTCCQVGQPYTPKELLSEARESSWFCLIATYSTAPFLNVFFVVFYSLTTYFYLYAMIEDPGYVPKLGSRNQQRAVIGELFEQWKFDEENFCVACMVRKPLRSKHCKRCGRCVTKHDQ